MTLTRITSDGITDAAIVNADINASAAISGSKVSPDFGSQTVTSSYLTLSAVNPNISFTDSNDNPDFKLEANSGQFKIIDTTNNADRLVVNSDGHVDIAGNLDVGAGIDVTGTITTTSTIEASNHIQITHTQPSLYLTDSNDNPDYVLRNNGGQFIIRDDTSGATRLAVNTDGHLDIAGNTDFGAGIDVTGNITVSGTVDGVDIAALNTTVGTKLANIVEDTSPQLGGDLDSNGNHIVITDGEELRLGNDHDTKIKFNGSKSQIVSSVQFDIDADIIDIHNAAQNATKARFLNNQVELYYNNSKKFETVSYGAVVTGTFQATGNIEVFDNGKLNIGTGADLQIYHDGSDSLIKDAGTGLLGILTNGFRVNNAANNESMIKADENGAVELYHNNSKRLETTSSGVNFGGNLSSDSGANFTINGGGASGSAGSVLLRCASENAVVCNANGAVDLYYNNVLKANTANGGFQIANNNHLYFLSTANYSPRIGNSDGGTGENMYFHTNNALRMVIEVGGAIRPGSNNTNDLGTTSDRWRNIYTNDLNLSNEGGANDVDGTWGSYTIQEGAEDLFLVNKRSGKKYKFNLTEVT